MELSSPLDSEFSQSPAVTPEDVVSQVQMVVEEALESGQPLELEPARTKLFDAFADAYREGLTGEGSPLTPDELTRLLGKRWGLDQSAQKSIADQQKLSESDLAKMRLLWATLRLWMEWDYAWSRWADYHGGGSPSRPR